MILAGCLPMVLFDLGIHPPAKTQSPLSASTEANQLASVPLY